MQDIRIAAIIMNSMLGAVRSNIDRMHAWIQKARNYGAHVVIFPELNITGYTIDNKLARASAERINGPPVSEIATFSKTHDITILAGLIERTESDQLFATHIVFHGGKIIGLYRKTHLSPPEKNIFCPGNDLTVFNLCGFSFGIQLCYDSHFPELSTQMALKGVDAIFMPHASPHGTSEVKYQSWMRHLPARAFDNSIFVVACNQVGDNGSGLFFPGVAVAIAPSGEVIQNITSKEETILIIDLTGNALHHVRKHRMRYFLPNRRPELFNS